jgi:hypothetical protein
MKKQISFQDFIQAFVLASDVLPCGTILIWTDTHVTIIKP